MYLTFMIMSPTGFILLPDISGFTEFVNTVELEHSRRIIKELLEIIIKTNSMKLRVSEIEGDAILFYLQGERPNLEIVYSQVEKMFLMFHEHLLLMENQRTCECNACVSAIHLTLKVISHYGEFAEYKIRRATKLIGRAVIVAHELLKNEIQGHEYWLISSDLSNKTPNAFKPWIQWENGSKRLNNLEVHFHFTHLSPLRKTFQPEQRHA